MQTIKIQTTQNIELEYELAGIGDRLVAYIVDLLIYVAYGIVVLLIIDAMGGFTGGIWLSFIIVLPIFFYQLLCEVFLNGQSVGKKIKHIRVISLDGNQPNLGQYIIRWLMRIVDTMFGSGVVAVVTIAVSPKAQRVGDMLAGTTVVRIRPSTHFRETIFTDTAETYSPQFPNATRLSESDISLLKEVVNRYQRDAGSNYSVLEKAYEKTRAVLQVHDEFEKLPFLETVIKDFNYLTGRAD